MTDEELIERLRAVCTCNIDSTPCMAEDDCRDALAAADRIEALTEQLTAARQDAKEAEAYAVELEKELNTCRMAQAVMDNTVANLEAKLAKAVEVLSFASNVDTADWSEALDVRNQARATLAEITSGVATTPYGLEGEKP